MYQAVLHSCSLGPILLCASAHWHSECLFVLYCDTAGNLRRAQWVTYHGLYIYQDVSWTSEIERRRSKYKQSAKTAKTSPRVRNCRTRSRSRSHMFNISDCYWPTGRPPGSAVVSNVVQTLYIHAKPFFWVIQLLRTKNYSILHDSLDTG